MTDDFFDFGFFWKIIPKMSEKCQKKNDPQKIIL